MFSNVVSLLSFAELGIGNAVIFSLYSPLVRQNIEQIKSLMVLYKKAYRIIRIVILGLGLGVLCFAENLVKDLSVDTSIPFIFLLFLINT